MVLLKLNDTCTSETRTQKYLKKRLVALHSMQSNMEWTYYNSRRTSWVHSLTGHTSFQSPPCPSVYFWRNEVILAEIPSSQLPEENPLLSHKATSALMNSTTQHKTRYIYFAKIELSMVNNYLHSSQQKLCLLSVISLWVLSHGRDQLTLSASQTSIAYARHLPADKKYATKLYAWYDRKVHAKWETKTPDICACTDKTLHVLLSSVPAITFSTTDCMPLASP